MKKTAEQIQQNLEIIFGDFLKASYGKSKLPFHQYKVVRETFFAGMIAGFRNTLEICSQDTPEEEWSKVLGFNAQILEKLAIDTAWAEFKVPLDRADSKFVLDQEKCKEDLKKFKEKAKINVSNNS